MAKNKDYYKAYTSVYNTFLRVPGVAKELKLELDVFAKRFDYLPDKVLKEELKKEKKRIVERLKKTTKTSFLGYTYEQQFKFIAYLRNDPVKLKKIYNRYTIKVLKNQYIENIRYALNHLRVQIPQKRINNIVNILYGLTADMLREIKDDLESILEKYDDETYTDELEIILQKIEAL